MADKKKKQYTHEGMDKSYRRLYSFVKPLFMLLFPFRKIHAENIPEGKVLICPNHFSDLWVGSCGGQASLGSTEATVT